EALLGRKLESLRRGVLALLLRLPDERALASAERLLGATSAGQRLAGLELTRLLREAGRAPERAVALAAAYRARHPQSSADEQALLDAMLRAARAVPTLDDALGLVRAADLTPLVPPRPRPVEWTSPAAVAALAALDALVHEHRDAPYQAATYAGQREFLLGGNQGQLPLPSAKLPVAEDVARLPLAEVWRGWFAGRPAEQRDTDGLELLRMLIQLWRRGDERTRALTAALNLPAAAALGRALAAGEDESGPRLTLRYPNVLNKLCWWLVRLDPPAAGADFALDHLEDELTRIPERELSDPEDGAPRYRGYQKLEHAVTLARTHYAYCPTAWSDAQVARLFHLLRWSVSLPQEHLRYVPTTAEALVAHRAGLANEADLLYHYLGPRAHARRYGAAGFDDLRAFSARQPHPLLAEFPIAGALYTRALERVLAVELERGQMPTAATPAALSLRSLAGAATFVRVLRALGDELFARGHAYGDNGRVRTLSHLLRITFPAAGDTEPALGKLLRAAGIGERRMVEVALYAPQWAALLEGVLGWPGFAEAVWWVYAHTKDSHWSVEQAIRESWAAAIAEWTPLSADDLAHGAVDVTWFQRAFGRLGEARWQEIYRAAKYTSGGAGHARAQLFADAMLGRVGEATLLARIRAKRHRDSACALGLVPLPPAPAAREPAVLARYQALQEFIRSAKTFGAQRREGDTRAAQIGIANLARTAGYTDPTRFQWTMELREADDLAAGPLTLARDAVTLTLRIDALGEPHLDVAKSGRALKDIPPALKRDPAVVALRERKRQLERQAARMRAALEQAMVREETFTAGELARLIGHPLLAPLLGQLVFVTPEGLSYVAGAGATLCALATGATLAPASTLRIAHPHDLLISGAWSAWQRECFAAERIQPFKQVFRELYPLTTAERDGAGDAVSRRYAGQQIQPQQAMALLAARGWVTNAGEGQAARTFHERGITVAVDFLYGGGTAADVEGLTIEGVLFWRAGGMWAKPVPLAEVPPVVFSEAMRDLDLVVSVAHRGGVDPEGSASTVEMRAALVREVTAALALPNVRIQSSHGVVSGTLGEYSVHLGSGQVHRLPGGALCIIPVHAQHRGRLFLPFADDDPKTAEIVSKVLLLARDAEIKDPLILQQLYAGV
ncbi:MAG TPA: DUF5724 domain-containing protein, partial [Ktedonobacterales bacterium]|nr:DUF5724 domain-containing protein [Ktedonobacterales bacterium]